MAVPSATLVASAGNIDPFYSAYASSIGEKPRKSQFKKYTTPDGKTHEYQSDHGYNYEAYNAALDAYNAKVQSAYAAATYALNRRQVRGKDWKPDIFDALAQRYLDSELERLAPNSTRGRLFSRPTGLYAGRLGA